MSHPASQTEQPALAECTAQALALLTRVEQAIWIYDLTLHRVVWANRAALGLWKATSLDELRDRNFDPTSPGTAERLANLRLRLARGETPVEQWVLYPLGEPLPVLCRFSGVLVPGGEIGMMVETLPREIDTDETNYELRAIEAVRQAPLMISLASPEGAWLMHNPAAEALIHRLDLPDLPDRDTFLALFADPDKASNLRAAAIRDGAAMDTMRLVGRAMRMHEVTVRRLIDPATGQLSLIVSQQDVTRAFRLERRLRKALVRERAMTDLQRQFLAVTSHDFRTPLSIIDSTARRIGKLAEGSAAILDRTATIRRAVRRMAQSIDKALTSAMIADGRVDFRPESADLPALLGQVVAGLRALHPNRSIGLDSDDLPAVTLDPVLAERVFENLIANAIKYSPEDRPVAIKAERDEDALVVTVTDRGIGIPAEDQPQIFSRYFRARNTRGTRGTGVGLHAVRLIMDLHRGTITLTSRENEGTVVRVSFPLDPAQ